jgi:hypothetical protein
VLVLVNLGKDAIAAPALTWEASSLKGKQRARLLLGSGKVSQLSVGEQGEADGYAPVSEVPPNGVVIIQFTP